MVLTRTGTQQTRLNLPPVKTQGDLDRAMRVVQEWGRDIDQLLQQVRTNDSTQTVNIKALTDSITNLTNEFTAAIAKLPRGLLARDQLQSNPLANVANGTAVTNPITFTVEPDRWYRCVVRFRAVGDGTVVNNANIMVRNAPGGTDVMTADIWISTSPIALGNYKGFHGEWIFKSSDVGLGQKVWEAYQLGNTAGATVDYYGLGGTEFYVEDLGAI